MSDRAAPVILEAWLAQQPLCLDADGWRLLHDGDVHSWLIGTALTALRSLPVEQRMAAMGMQRVAVWPDGMRVEAEPDPEGSFWVGGGDEVSEAMESGEHVGTAHDPKTCEGAWCSTCLAERATKATARRAAARKGAETRKRRSSRG